jgi:hypothetical protein
MTTNTETPTTDNQWCASERVARQMLALIGDHPGTIGTLRCARIVGGFTVPVTDPEHQELFAQYAVADLDWTLRTLKDLVEALQRGGLMATSSGPRPTLALTHAGHHALDALDADRSRS